MSTEAIRAECDKLDAEIAARDAEIAALKLRIAELENPPPPPPPPPPSTLYISPDGTGGGSRSDPAPLSALNDVIAQARASRADVRLMPGTYRAAPIALNQGGTEDFPVVIHGEGATIVGNRNTGEGSIPWELPQDPSGARNVKQAVLWGGRGGDLFDLRAGASHLLFDGLGVRQVGRAWWLSADGLYNITWQDIYLFNCQDYFGQAFTRRDDGTFPETHNLTWRRCDGAGFSKSAIRLDGGTHDVLIDDCMFDSWFQSNDEFAVGIKIGSSSTVGGSNVHDVLIRHVGCHSCIDVETSGYWNGDGITIERGDHDIHIEDFHASWNSDGGIDSKGTNIVLLRPRLHDNKDNVRCWGEMHIIDGRAYDNHKITGAPWGNDGGTGVSMNVMVNKEDARLHLWGSFDGTVGFHEGATAAQLFDHRPNYPD
jgi:hypothetical protein